nr:hypothetical protein [Nostoc sp. DedQUE02]
MSDRLPADIVEVLPQIMRSPVAKILLFLAHIIASLLDMQVQPQRDLHPPNLSASSVQYLPDMPSNCHI